MVITIVHELPGRMRLRATRREAAALSRGMAVGSSPGVFDVLFSPMAASLLVRYDPGVINRNDLLLTLDTVVTRGQTGQEGSQEGGGLLAIPDKSPPSETPPGMTEIMATLALQPFLPSGLNRVLAIKRAWPRLRRGLGNLWHRILDVNVLNAAAIAICIILRDFRSLTAITILLAIGESLEHWTKKRSAEDLADSLARHAIKARVRQGKQEKLVDATALRVGDMVVVRQGNFIPADGVVKQGEGMVDQSLMTGEAKFQEKRPGKAVFAGSVLEEGELLIQATEDGDKTVWRRTLLLLEDADQRKAGIQSQAERLAGRLAPFSLGLALLVFLITRDLRRTAAVLLVDYSCAIKLATPLAVLSAMRQATSLGAMVRGGRHLEDLAKADVFIFDKTGTLTMATPSVHDIVPCNGWTRHQALRLAACLEEHFPHPVAKAVVHQADIEGLEHEEHHLAAEYVTAHGVASCLEGHRILLGSRHFIEDDENIDISPLQSHTQRWEDLGQTIIYLTVGGKLVAGFALEDPPRPEAAQVISTLRGMGVRRVIILTGDLDGMAARSAEELGVTEWMAQALPDDKVNYIKSLKEAGHITVMVGDGLNDAAAIAEASVGCCMHKGADMARDIADIVLTSNNLMALPTLRALAAASLSRIRYNFAFIVGVNSILLAGALVGVSSPALGALLHNSATIAAAINAIRPYTLPQSLAPATGGK
ncbi:MAG: heavy metal translocating P-type ATPase [Desulfobulbaceae bacterium]|nr:MAG: heavy metal translocating P-type ATPase [Desulfobulbaceae bacterium]